MKYSLRSVELVPLNDAEYGDFAERQLVETAYQRVRGGDWKEEVAADLSRESLTDLLSDSLRGSGHTFLKGIDTSGALVGWLWVSPAPEFLGEDRDRKRWLSQITVESGLRHCGYGRALLEALHRRLEEQGVEELWLRVYHWNETAIRLYEKTGYEVMKRFSTDSHMRRRIANPAAVP